MAPRRRVDREVAFWLLALLLILLLAGASAPSPLYALYQDIWQFQATTLTAVYASYAVGGVASLLTTGRLPDYLGRRNVLGAGLAIGAASMLVFVFAGDVTALFIGRILAGVGISMGVGAVSAWLLDLSPRSDPTLGSLVGGAGPLLGLGVGALLAGLLVEYGPDRLHFVYGLLAAFYGAGLVLIFAIEDRTARRAGWVASLRPTIGVPVPARSTFMAGLPAVIGMWALAGLYLALGPSLAFQLLATDNRAVGGLVIFALTGTGAIAAVAVRWRDPNRLLVRGPAIVIFGVVITLVAVSVSSAVLLFGGTIVAGIGLGAGFSAFVRATAPLAPPEQRAALLAAVVVVVYLSFSVPTILAGAATTVFGLVPTTYAYGVIVVALAGMTTFAVARRLRLLGPSQPSDPR